jgi:predicted PurR-regulated permease PerM
MPGFDLRAAKVVWTAFLVAFVLYIIYLIRSTLLLVIFAVFFSYLLYPLVRLAERYKPPGMPRAAAIFVVYILLAAVVLTAVTLFGRQIADEATYLGQQLPALLSPANISRRLSLPDFLDPLWTRALDFMRQQLQGGTGDPTLLVQRVGKGITRAVGGLFYVVLVPILSFLLITTAPKLRAAVLPWLDKSSRGFWMYVAKDLHALLAAYVRALLLLSLAVLVNYSIVFLALGVPYALFFAGISAVLEFIPIFGPLASIATILLLSAISGYPHLLWLAAFLLAYRVFQDYVLNPYLMSEEAQIQPLFVIIGLLAGEQIGGVAGVFLSVPALATLKIILRHTAALLRQKKKGQQGSRSP